MGVRLVGATYDPHWSRTLSYAELRLLGAMALSALDTPGRNRPAELYYGGEEALVIALTGDCPDPGTPAHHTQTVKVGKIIRRLIQARAVERVTEGRRGQKAVYRLTLDSHRQPSLLDSQPVDNSANNVHPLPVRAALTTSLTEPEITSLTHR